MAHTHFLFTMENVKGGQKDGTFPDSMALKAFSWQARTPNDVTLASTGRMQLGHLVCVKLIDKASPILFKFIGTNQLVPKAQLTCNRQGDDKAYYEINLTNARVAAISLKADAGLEVIPEETISIAYETFEIVFREQMPTGKLGGDIMYQHSVALNR